MWISFKWTLSCTLYTFSISDFALWLWLKIDSVQLLKLNFRGVKFLCLLHISSGSFLVRRFFSKKEFFVPFRQRLFQWIRFGQIISLASFRSVSPPLFAQNPCSIRWNEKQIYKNRDKTRTKAKILCKAQNAPSKQQQQQKQEEKKRRHSDRKKKNKTQRDWDVKQNWLPSISYMLHTQWESSIYLSFINSIAVPVCV